MRKRYKRLSLAGWLVGVAIGGAMFGGEVEAVGADFKYVELSIGQATALEGGSAGNGLINEQVLAPTETDKAVTSHYWVPVTIDMSDAGEYSVSVRAAEDNSTALEATGVTPTIPSITEPTVLQELKDKWGIRGIRIGKDAEQNPVAVTAETFTDGASEIPFSPVPEADDEMGLVFMYGGNGGTAKEHAILDFGTGVTGAMPSGRYGTTLTVTAIAKPVAVAAFYRITEMQEMSAGVCASVETPTTTTLATTMEYATDGAAYGRMTLEEKRAIVPQTVLTDNRDGKKYIVRKLADGNCWMSQNLEFDMVATKGSYASNATTQLTGTTVGGVKLTNQNTDLGSLAEWTPDTARTSGYSSVGANAVTIYQTQNAYGSGKAWGSNANGDAGMYSLNSAAAYTSETCSTATSLSTTSNSTFGYDTCTQDGPEAYRRFGNLYNWTTATLGSGLSKTNASGNEEAAISICPAGWRLPPNSGDKSYLNLLQKYLPSNNLSGSTDRTSSSSVVKHPLNFYRTGYYNYSDGTVYNRSAHGSWWSNTTQDATNAYYLYAYTTGVNAQDYDNRGNGYAIRCVAR